jgi:hypothetical protein
MFYEAWEKVAEENFIDVWFYQNLSTFFWTYEHY